MGKAIGDPGNMGSSSHLDPFSNYRWIEMGLFHPEIGLVTDLTVVKAMTVGFMRTINIIPVRISWRFSRAFSRDLSCVSENGVYPARLGKALFGC